MTDRKDCKQSKLISPQGETDEVDEMIAGGEEERGENIETKSHHVEPELLLVESYSEWMKVQPFTKLITELIRSQTHR